MDSRKEGWTEGRKEVRNATRKAGRKGSIEASRKGRKDWKEGINEERRNEGRRKWGKEGMR